MLLAPPPRPHPLSYKREGHRSPDFKKKINPVYRIPPLWLEAVRTSQSEHLTPQDPYLERGVASEKDERGGEKVGSSRGISSREVGGKEADLRPLSPPPPSQPPAAR